MEPKNFGEGWIKLYRQSLKSRVFANADLWKVWTWCLLKANHKESWVSVSTGRGTTEVKVLPGQFIFGRNVAAEELKMVPSSVRKRMCKLENMGNLNIQRNTHFSIITIIKWKDYQEENIKSNRQGDNQVTGKEQASDTNKNDKNEKKEGYSSKEEGKFSQSEIFNKLNQYEKEIIEVYETLTTNIFKEEELALLRELLTECYPGQIKEAIRNFSKNKPEAFGVFSYIGEPLGKGMFGKRKQKKEERNGKQSPRYTIPE
ncbi:MAG: hypothetical protein PHW62_03480 [Candidatus Ratteibacteria bacterium]|nr:hypothetical protein [Candidatus Ratteibacteria bacterium]